MKRLFLTLLILSVCVPAFARAGDLPQEAIANRQLDEITWSQVNVDKDISAIHSGESFVTSDAVDLPASGGMACYILSPDSTGSKYVHYTLLVGAENDTVVVFYEDPQESMDTANIISIDGVNRNRTSSTTADMEVWVGNQNAPDTCISADISGDAIVTYWIPGGTETREEKFVLSNDIGYMIWLENQEASTSLTTTVFSWSELTNRSTIDD